MAYISITEKSERRSESAALARALVPCALLPTYHEACLHRGIPFIFPPLIHEITKNGIPEKGGGLFEGGTPSNQLQYYTWNSDHELLASIVPRVLCLAACFVVTTTVLAPFRVDLPASVFSRVTCPSFHQTRSYGILREQFELKVIYKYRKAVLGLGKERDSNLTNT